MKYYVFNKYDKGQYSENAMCRRDLDGDWLICKSHDQLKSWRGKKYSKDRAGYTFECHGSKRIEEFENWLKDNFNIPSYATIINNYEEDRSDEYANQLYQLHNESDKLHRFTVSKKTKDVQIIYLLKYNNEVVYVGQSNSTGRPYQHTDKKWDEVEYIFIPNRFNLSLVEKTYIDRYKPKYNKGNPISNSVMKRVYQKLINKIN
jgi:hypothetical protein